MTHDTGLAAEELRRTHRSRANEENCIQELKESYGWHEFNVRSFWGTEAAMLRVGKGCDHLIHHLNRTVLKAARHRLVRLGDAAAEPGLAIPVQQGSSGR